MWIVWGTKLTRRRVGMVADYCPLCHESRAFVLSQLGRATHLYGIAVGNNVVTGHVITCDGCQMDLDSDPHRYLTALPEAPPDVRALSAATHPTLPELERSQREWMRRLRDGESQGRAEAITRPLYLVAVAFERRKLTMQLGFAVWASLIAASVLMAVGLGDAISSVSANLTLTLVPTVLMAILWIAVIAGLATDSARYTSRMIHPALKRALGPLRPSVEELQTARSELTRLQLRLASRLEPASIKRVLTS